jgi:hypothetical protein
LSAEQTYIYCINSLKDAILINKHWIILLKEKNNKIQTTEVLSNIRAVLSNEAAIWQGYQQRPSNHWLKRSTEHIPDFLTNAWETRITFLLKLQHWYKTLKDKKREKTIVRIRKSKMTARATQICKNINKPCRQSGGLSKVIINTTAGEVMVENPAEMETYLLEINKQHFAQTHHTPCILGELANILGTDGFSIRAQHASEGKIHGNTPDEIKLILNELKQLWPSMSSYLLFESMLTGFQRWREKQPHHQVGNIWGCINPWLKCTMGTTPGTQDPNWQFISSAEMGFNEKRRQ